MRICLFAACLAFALRPAAAQEESLWHLVSPKIGTPLAGPALMQVADLTRSDPGIAGLMFRCGAQGLETLVVLLDPLPPRSKAIVTLTAGPGTRSFEASPVPTGAALLIPFDPRPLLAGPWKQQRDLTISAVSGSTMVRAIVDLNGLSLGLYELTAACSLQSTRTEGASQTRPR